MRKSIVMIAGIFLLMPLIGCENKQSDVFKVKEVTLFKYDALTTSKVNLCFRNDDMSIPYINLHDGVNLLYEVSDFKNEKAFKIDEIISGDVFSFKRENGGMVSFDISTSQVSSDDLNLFKVAPHASTPLDLTSVDPNFYDESGKPIEGEIRLLANTNDDGGSFYKKGKEVVMNLKDYDISLYKVNGRFYCPFTTFYNILGQSDNTCAYNGENLFLNAGTLDESILDASNKSVKDHYYSFSCPNRPESLIKYSYNELCRDMDFVYGLKDTHGINNGFDTFFKECGIKDYLLTDAVDVIPDAFGPNIALNMLSFLYLADMHTGFSFSSPYFNGKQNVPDALVYALFSYFGRLPMASEFLANSNDASARNDYREEQQILKTIGEGPFASSGVANPCLISDDGKSMILTFDSFLMRKDIDFYYSDEFKLHKKDYIQNQETGEVDIVALSSFANDELRNNMGIENLIIDISCNSGGMVDAAIFFLSWLNSGKMILEDPHTGAKAVNSYVADVNFDKEYVVGDDCAFYVKEGKLSKKRDLNLYCLTSMQSFSCANYVPAMLKQTGKGKMIGTKSGGGACAVRVSSLGDGSGFSFSSNYRLCQSVNGSFYHIDKGIEADYLVSDLKTLYGGTNGNRGNISDFVNRLN